MKGEPALLCLSLLCAILAGCGARTGGEGPPSSPQRSEVTGAEEGSTTARVVCGGGVSVLTPEVASRPDGLHIAIDNRLRGRADLSVSHPEGGMGWSVPSGESARVANVPPGKVEIDCFSRSWGREQLFAMGTETVRVLAGASGYKSAELYCSRGKPAGGMKPYTEEDTGAREADPTDATRRTGTRRPYAWCASAR